MLRLVVVPTTFQASMLLWPVLIVEGLAVKLAMVGGLTTVTVAWAENLVPVPSMAVRVYAVVTGGVTTRLVLPVTSPIPGSMVICTAPVTSQLKVLLWPSAIGVGFTVKLLIFSGSTTVTVTVAVLLPAGLLALSV
jgi:hypothetical protein